GPRPFDAHVAAEVELRFVPGGALEGRARMAPLIDPAGIVLAIHRGDGHVRTLRLDASGSYRLAGLTPGPWEVRALDDEIIGSRSNSSSTVYDEGENAPPFENWNCEVRA